MYPKINQTVIINTKDHSYKTMIAEITDHEILIGYPMVGDHVEMLPEDTKLEVIYVLGDNQYRIITEIVGRKKDRIPLYRMRKPKEDEIQKIQRRENFRVSTNLNLKVKDQNFTTLNISGGGLLFACPIDFEIKPKEEITCELMLPTSKDIEKVSFTARAVRILPQNDPPANHIGMEFAKMDERTRTKIIQYCFEKQRQNRVARR